jgi:hypothetical protein
MMLGESPFMSGYLLLFYLISSHDFWISFCEVYLKLVLMSLAFRLAVIEPIRFSLFDWIAS